MRNAPGQSESTFLHRSVSDRCRWCFRFCWGPFLYDFKCPRGVRGAARGARGARFPYPEVSEVRSRCAVLVFRGARGAPFPHSEVPEVRPSRGSIILLSHLGATPTHTPVARLDPKNFSPILSPARRLRHKHLHSVRCSSLPLAHTFLSKMQR